MRTFLLISLLLIIAGCDQDAMLKKLADPEDEAKARQTIGLLREQRFDELEAALDPSIRGPNIRDTLRQMAELIPAGEPVEVKLVGMQISKSADHRTSNITYQYEFPDRWLLINVAVLASGNQQTVVGFNVNQMQESLEQQTKFRLSSKTPLHYATAFLVLAAPILTLYALIACIRTKIARRKWLWIIFILFGFGQFSLNWTTGDWWVTPVAVQLFSASATAPLYGPWTLSFSLPLGAIVFLLRRKRLAFRPSES